MFNDSIKLKWQGKEYDCPITMSLAKKMEKGGLNILATAVELDKGGIPPITLVSELYAWLLVEGGCDVSEDQVYESIMSDPVNSSALVLAAKRAINLFFPPVDGAERTSKKSKKS